MNVDGMIAVWFSSGAASAVAAKMAVDLYGKGRVRVINNPVAEEDEDNKRFLLDVQNWIGVPVERATHSAYPSASAAEVWERRQWMSGPKGAPCTMLLKKEARQQWESINNPDWHVFGFTADEKKRHDLFVLTERSNVLPVLIDAGITKAECFNILESAGIAIPRIYSLGYPNANCIGCVKATSPTYWNHVRKVHPAIFEQRSEQSRRIGAKLARHKNKRVYLDQLPADAKGRPMKNMNIECGILCEEKIK